LRIIFKEIINIAEKYKLKIKAFGSSFLFAVENTLLGLAEIFVSHLHAALSQSQQPSFCANGLKVNLN